MGILSHPNSNVLICSILAIAFVHSIANETFSEHLVAIFINLVVTSGNLKLQYHLYKLGNLTLSKIKSSEHKMKSSSSYALQGLFQISVEGFFASNKPLFRLKVKLFHVQVL